MCWPDVGAELVEQVEGALDELAIAVEHIGSTAVPELLAEPIIDVAVGVDRSPDLAAIDSRLVDAGWIYRGDAGPTVGTCSCWRDGRGSGSPTSTSSSTTGSSSGVPVVASPPSL
jgi:GrpB-like predicted nucleotidyltransferase (UPF0157 family)